MSMVNFTNVRHDHDNTAPTNSYADVKYDEVRYFTVGGANAATYVNFTLPLSIFKNTLLAVDKDLYFNEVMLLKLVWNPVARVAFASNAHLAAQTVQNQAIVIQLVSQAQQARLHKLQKLQEQQSLIIFKCFLLLRKI